MSTIAMVRIRETRIIVMHRVILPTKFRALCVAVSAPIGVAWPCDLAVRTYLRARGMLLRTSRTREI